MPLASRMMMSTLHFESSSASAARVRSIISKSSGRARSRSVRGSLTSCAPLTISLADICAPPLPRRLLGPVGDALPPGCIGFGPAGEGDLCVRQAAEGCVCVRVVEDVERLVWLGGELEVGTAALVGDADAQLTADLVPEEHDLDAIVCSVCELSIELVRGVGACHGGSFLGLGPRGNSRGCGLDVEFLNGSTIAAGWAYVSGAGYRISCGQRPTSICG